MKKIRDLLSRTLSIVRSESGGSVEILFFNLPNCENRSILETVCSVCICIMIAMFIMEVKLLVLIIRTDLRENSKCL